MKNTKKMIAIAVAALAILFTTNAKAQTTPPSAWRLGIGIEGGIPTGNAHDISNFELGGTARLQYDASKNVALMLTSGYYNFFGKSIPDLGGIKYKSLGMIPVKAGVKAFFAPNVYVSGEAGAGFETSAFGDFSGDRTAGLEKDTKLILSPGVGYACKSWDVGVRYENYSGQGNSYGLVGLRIAYGFGL
ncbi:hypothetical protein ACPPVU_16605 [Mucilaginibacter sp. McL0603]|uniref:hypothetical protein n=1 Tax=Mucilaginibacter sp. McL0603 TaxID=3415670 RepID=UPI003CF2BB23